jgi:hypothetical protein
MNYLNKRSTRGMWWSTFLLILLTAACGSGVAPTAVVGTVSPTTIAVQQLRIVNGGSADIKGLTVLFPGVTSTAEATQVSFGDVAVGETTAYRDVPSGVYRYAAYTYLLEGKTVTQPVIDWVGESPMAGTQFTYPIKLDLGKVQGNQIELVEVLVDAP